MQSLQIWHKILIDKQKDMDKDQERYQEQDAPIKNTDHAYVRVSEDGSPVMPDETDDKDKKDTAQRIKEDEKH
jgi:hypothetical protein